MFQVRFEETISIKRCDRRLTHSIRCARTEGASDKPGRYCKVKPANFGHLNKDTELVVTAGEQL